VKSERYAQYCSGNLVDKKIKKIKKKKKKKRREGKRRRQKTKRSHVCRTKE
jgi:hypothetical protein